MPSQLTVRQVGPVTLVELSGRLVWGEPADKLDQKLQDLVVGGCSALLVDCSQVSYVDSQGIKALVRGLTSIAKRGGKLKLLRISPRVREVLSVTRLLTVMESFDDEESALRSFAS